MNEGSESHFVEMWMFKAVHENLFKTWGYQNYYNIYISNQYRIIPNCLGWISVNAKIAK